MTKALTIEQSKSGRPHRRQQRAAESFRSAAEAIGPIVPGLNLFLFTRGQFGMLDIITHVVDQIGAADLSVWAWAIADYEVDAIAALMSREAIRSARLVIDRSAEQRDAGLMRLWRERYGAEAVRVCKNHAKMARMWTADRHVLARGSLNMNYSPRFENVDISEGGPEFDLVAGVEADLPILRARASNTEAESASGLGRAFERKTLEMFRGLRRWSK